MEHSVKTFLHLTLAGIDVSITSIIAWMLVGLFLLILILTISVRKISLVPRNVFQNLMESFVGFIDKEVILAAGLKRGKFWPPFFLSLFLFILIQNWLGVIPGALPPSGNINMTGSLAALMFLMAIVLRFKKKGGFGFIKSLIPHGVSGPIVLFLFPLEVVSFLFKPISLAIRLFANMTGGHLLLLTILGFTMMFKHAIIDVVSVGGAVVILGFELFVGLIQAYVFTFLSALMMSEALSDEH